MNTITISTEEYKALTEKAIVLDIILDTTDYRITDVLNAYRDAVKSRKPKEVPAPKKHEPAESLDFEIEGVGEP